MPMGPGVLSLTASISSTCAEVYQRGLLAQVVEEGQRGHPAADGEDAYLEELPEELEQQQRVCHFAAASHLQLVGDERDDDAGYGRGHDEQYGRGAREGAEREDGQEDYDEGLPVHDGALPELDDGVDDEHDDAGPDAGEGVLHHGVLGEAGEEHGDDGYDYEARQGRGEAGHEAAERTLAVLADEGRGVDHDDAGQALGHGVVVHDLLVGRPAVVLDDVALQYGQHGVAAAEGEAADLHEGP